MRLAGSGFAGIKQAYYPSGDRFMPEFPRQPPVPPESSWWRRQWSSFKKDFLGQFKSQGDWFVFGLVVLATLWLLGRVIGLLRKLLGW